MNEATFANLRPRLSCTIIVQEALLSKIRTGTTPLGYEQNMSTAPHSIALLSLPLSKLTLRFFLYALEALLG